LRTQTIKRDQHKTRDFYVVVRPSNTCLLPRCGVPMDEGCTQPLSSDPMINLNTTAFPLDDYSCLRGISTRLESLALTTKITMKARSKVGIEQHTQDTNHSTPTHTREELSSNDDTGSP
jgi:hypothetical protein